MDYPSINIILDDRSPDDYGRLLGEFIQQGITKYKFWDAVILTHSVVESINRSHKNIVARAKGQGYKKCIIAEQDVTFSASDAWQFFLKNEPESYDLYLWGSYIPPVSNNKVCGFQLYIISEKFYDSFLSIPDNVHIDTYMDELKGDYKFCYPFPALQRPGFSSNNMAHVNYNEILEEKDIYRG